eukprot:1199523-Lingulodinium_polyedra.AAC.1
MEPGQIETVWELLKVYNRPGGWARDHTSQGVLCAALEAGKVTLQQMANVFWGEVGCLPALVSYSNDGTPLNAVTHRLPYTNAEGKLTEKKGRRSVEVLVQNCFLRYLHPTGDDRTTVLLRDPLPLTQGKAGSAMLACIKDFCPLAREKGCTGIVIHHYVFDGALRAYLSRRMRQHHMAKALERQPEGRAAGLDPTRLFLKEWV